MKEAKLDSIATLAQPKAVAEKILMNTKSFILHCCGGQSRFRRMMAVLEMELCKHTRL
jgi:hypothetical protein